MEGKGKHTYLCCGLDCSFVLFLFGKDVHFLPNKSKAKEQSTPQQKISVCTFASNLYLHSLSPMVPKTMLNAGYQ